MAPADDPPIVTADDASLKPDSMEEDDPEIEIRVTDVPGDYYADAFGPWRIKKSLLAKHSESFRAMFRSGFKEANENRVVLHEDDPYDLENVLHFIATDCYPLEIRKQYLTEWLAAEEVMNITQKELVVLDKYECDKLLPALFEIMSLALMAMIPDWQSQRRGEGKFMEHYSSVVRYNKRRYPAELYPAFAYAWSAFANVSTETPRMTAIVHANAELAAFIAMSYRSKIGKLREIIGTTKEILIGGLED